VREEERSKVGSASLLLVGVMINPSDPPGFFDIFSLV
jgi:hypothetical protein